jgi:hypothetical protein
MSKQTLEQVLEEIKAVAVKAGVDPNGGLVRKLTEDLKKQQEAKKEVDKESRRKK